ncbi:MAG: hypothetical protein VYD87_09850, partial [Pseudomonadota bacterium]|nr:hypothetical protein [Pseudomonadota bacterium]
LEAEADRAAAAAKRAAEASRDAARAAAEAEGAANEAAAAADAMRDAVAAGRTVTAPVAAPTPAPAAVAAEDPTDPAVIARYASAPGFKLGEAEIGRWTERPVTADDGAKGAVAQVNARGEGRFAVVCMPGDRGAVAYRAPLKMREALLAEGDRLTVDFIFDGKDTISRQLAWNEAGRYWTGPFAPESALAERMKKAMAVTIDVKGFDGVASEFSLDNSWRSIEAMFNDC